MTGLNQLKNLWSDQYINSEIQNILPVLKEKLQSVSHRDCSGKIFEMSLQHYGKPSQEAKVKAYVYGIMALAYAEKYGGLSGAQLEHVELFLNQLLTISLSHQNLKRPSRLNMDIYRLKSQIMRRDGRHWLSAWNSYYVDVFNPPGRDYLSPQDYYARGLREMRLGNTAKSLKLFAQVDKKSCTETLRLKVDVEEIRLFRLSNRFAEALARIKGVSAQNLDLPVVFQNELAWEHLCIEMMQLQSINPLVGIMRSKEKFFYGDYILEMYFWTSMAKAPHYRKILPKIATMRKNAHLGLRSQKVVLNCAAVIEQCYDESIPLHIRINNLGNMLAGSSELLTIDKELLVVGSALRFLSQMKFKNLTLLVLEHYRGLCRRLTEGKFDDVFGFLTDLMEYYDEENTSVGEDFQQAL